MPFSVNELEDITLSKLSSSHEGLYLLLMPGDALTLGMGLSGASDSLDLNRVLKVFSERFGILPNNILVPVWPDHRQPDHQSISLMLLSGHRWHVLVKKPNQIAFWCKGHMGCTPGWTTGL